MSKQVFMTRNLAFGAFLEQELVAQGVKAYEFERVCGISKDALNKIKKA
mgnify:FL=1